MSEIELEAKAIAAICFRNSYLEDIHSKNTSITDDEMKKLMKDVVNRIYTLLLLKNKNLTAYTALLKFANEAYTKSLGNPEITNL